MKYGLNIGDSAWVLVSFAMILLMTPGLALCYGGSISLLGKQIVAILAVGRYGCVLTYLIGKAVGVLFAFRPSVREEAAGLDTELRIG
ncbi:ammonium transporter, Amt family [Thermomonospora echinospora]|uniref:Ammonium transporter, Amt family n=1 Tax=Thermomonospora echinospora TaxID=1992 RepID=A0A1H6E341_9ACTN|nr:ammonium transporter [Thermomonospora echinospora]SEG92098.1 ammonium transporter, Amt family [Thermomonospora echinospora]